MHWPHEYNKWGSGRVRASFLVASDRQYLLHSLADPDNLLKISDVQEKPSLQEWPTSCIIDKIEAEVELQLQSTVFLRFAGIYCRESAAFFL